MLAAVAVFERRQRKCQIGHGFVITQCGEQQYRVDRREDRFHVHHSPEGCDGLLDRRVVVLGDLVVEIAMKVENGAADRLDLIHTRRDLRVETLHDLSQHAYVLDP